MPSTFLETLSEYVRELLDQCYIETIYNRDKGKNYLIVYYPSSVEEKLIDSSLYIGKKSSLAGYSNCYLIDVRTMLKANAESIRENFPVRYLELCNLLEFNESE